jgi:1-acyl-sn-glycerol-3-phosphate acyltransferase
VTEYRYTISYPRKRVARGITRALGRLVLPIAFRTHVAGRENFPQCGPLLVVGNHVAVMEAVMMAVYTPWQVEMLGAADIPHEKVTQIAIKIFGFIPVNRGHVDRPALKQALDVLKQGGVVGIFPEGGIWEPGTMRAQAGVAWLSYRARTPVLPTYFGSTPGALGAALRLKRPPLTMRVGQLVPAARLPRGEARKAYLEAYAAQVMDAVNALCPADDQEHQPEIIDERFELQVAVHEPGGKPASYPAGLDIRHSIALAKFLHRPAILKIFRKNLRLPMGALQDLENVHDAGQIAGAIQSVLDYLEHENPYLLTYRFGPKGAEAMQLGLEELLALARWAAESGLSLTDTPVRRYYAPDQDEEVVQTRQGSFERWM